jgi:hypothetical protein
MMKRASILAISILAASFAATALLGWLGHREPVLAAPVDPAGELRVCPFGCPYSSIQAAVSAANSGDVIKIAAGTYTDVHHIPSLDTSTFTASQIVAITKAVALQGGYSTSNWLEPDPASNPTMLDARGVGRAVLISGTADATLTGLRITGGDASNLGGTPWGEGVGGGVCVLNASATISGSRVSSNTATAYGGGLYLENSPITLSNSTIANNTASRRGGGLYVTWDSHATMTSNNVVSNFAAHEGGGICIYWSDVRLVDNLISHNSADLFGGGLYLYGGETRLDRNRIVGNSAHQGGGINLNYLWDTPPSFANSVIVQNRAEEGSGLWFTSPYASETTTVTMLHTTLANNSGGGEGMHLDGSAILALTNTIVASHTVGITATSGTTITLNATLWDGNASNSGGSGHLTTMHNYSGSAKLAGDGYHLTLASAALDRGVEAGVMLDVDGDGRPFGKPDLGADELHVSRVYLPLVSRNS